MRFGHPTCSWRELNPMLIGLSSVLMNAQVYKMHMEMNSEQCTPLLRNKVEPEKQFQQERFGTRSSNLK